MGVSIPLLCVPGPMGGGATSLTDDFTADSGQWLDGTLSPLAMSIDAGQGYWSPSLGAELLTNGSFETGDPPSNWTYVLATASQVADPAPSGGSSALHLQNTNDTANTSGYQTTSVSAGFRLASCWRKNIDATGTTLRVTIGGSGGTLLYDHAYDAGTSWTQQGANVFDTTGSSTIILYVRTLSNNTGARYDLATYKDITETSMLALRKLPFGGSIAVQAALTRSLDTFQGVVAWKDANNMIAAYLYNDDTVRLYKKVSGTWAAVLGSAAITESAGAVLRLYQGANANWNVSYNGTDEITEVTISDVTSPGYAGLFSGYDGNRFDDFLAEAV